MLDRLRELTDYPDENIGAEPEGIKQDWPRFVRDGFGGLPETERNAQCQLMIIAADPSSPAANRMWATNHVFKSPLFEVEEIAGLASIVSGNAYVPCQEVVDRFSSESRQHEFMVQGEVGSYGGMGSRHGQP
jgi:hypothetical protein